MATAALSFPLQSCGRVVFLVLFHCSLTPETCSFHIQRAADLELGRNDRHAPVPTTISFFENCTDCCFVLAFSLFCVLFVKSDSHPPFWHPFSHSVVIHTHLSDIPFHTVWWLTPIFLTSFFTQCKCLSLQFSFSVRGEKRKWLFWIKKKTSAVYLSYRSNCRLCFR